MTVKFLIRCTHLDDKMHLKGARGLIRNQLIGLPAMQNGKRFGRFSSGVDKEIRCGNDGAALRRHKCQLKPVPASIMSQTALAFWKELSHTTTVTTACQCLTRGKRKGLSKRMSRRGGLHWTSCFLSIPCCADYSDFDCSWLVWSLGAVITKCWNASASCPTHYT